MVSGSAKLNQISINNIPLMTYAGLNRAIMKHHSGLPPNILYSFRNITIQLGISLMRNHRWLFLSLPEIRSTSSFVAFKLGLPSRSPCHCGFRDKRDYPKDHLVFDNSLTPSHTPLSSRKTTTISPTQFLLENLNNGRYGITYQKLPCNHLLGVALAQFKT